MTAAGQPKASDERSDGQSCWSFFCAGDLTEGLHSAATPGRTIFLSQPSGLPSGRIPQVESLRPGSPRPGLFLRPFCDMARPARALEAPSATCPKIRKHDTQTNS